MKKTVIMAVVLSLLAVGLAYAHMSGGGAWGGGPMMKSSLSAEEQKALDETSELRKGLVLKKFELREAFRKGEYQRAEAIDKEITELVEKLKAKLGDKKVWGKHGKGKRGGFRDCSCVSGGDD